MVPSWGNSNSPGSSIAANSSSAGASPCVSVGSSSDSPNAISLHMFDQYNDGGAKSATRVDFSAKINEYGVILSINTIF